VNPVAEVLLIESTGRYLYSGGAEPSDELAMKAADHELRGAVQYFSVQQQQRSAGVGGAMVMKH